MARRHDGSANQPQWKAGWEMANGYYHHGFWYVRHGGKRVSLAHPCRLPLSPLAKRRGTIMEFSSFGVRF